MELEEKLKQTNVFQQILPLTFAYRDLDLSDQQVTGGDEVDTGKVHDITAVDP